VEKAPSPEGPPHPGQRFEKAPPNPSHANHVQQKSDYRKANFCFGGKKIVTIFLKDHITAATLRKVMASRNNKGLRGVGGVGGR
jgi:hypothetical protein